VDEYAELFSLIHLIHTNLIGLMCHISITLLVGGIPTPLKNDGVSNSWDDNIPNCFWKVNPNSMLPVTSNKNHHHIPIVVGL